MSGSCPRNGYALFGRLPVRYISPRIQSSVASETEPHLNLTQVTLFAMQPGGGFHLYPRVLMANGCYLLAGQAH